VADNVSAIPDVVYVKLHFHPTAWTTGEATNVYKFRVTGKSWGATRWVVHAVWADKPAPTDIRLRTTGMLKALLSTCLADQLGRVIPQWENDLLGWEWEAG